MKSNAFDRLWHLYLSFDPLFESTFKVEFPKLPEKDKLRFIDLMIGEIDERTAELKKLQMAAAH